MLTHAADTADSSDRPRDCGRSKELDRWKKPAYFDSAREGGGAEEGGTDSRRHVKNNWFRRISATVIIINRLGPLSLSSVSLAVVSAVKTPIIADNDDGRMTDR